VSTSNENQKSTNPPEITLEPGEDALDLELLTAAAIAEMEEKGLLSASLQGELTPSQQQDVDEFLTAWANI
jgi:hypothetical protein